MTSTAQTASDASTVLGPSPASQTSDASQNHQTRGGRAMGGSTGQGEGSGRGRGGREGGARRGRGARGANTNTSRVGRVPQDPNDRPPPTAPPPGLGGRGSFGARLTGDADKTQGAALGKKPEGKVSETDGAEAAEAEVCFICASPVVHNAVSPCNHRTCHICALRLRALYKTKACAHCRVGFPFRILLPTSRWH